MTARADDVTAPAVRLDEVSKLFGSTVAVEQLSLSVESGTFITLLGPSGCGKTTTLRMIAGLEEPTAGGIWIHGRHVSTFTPRDRPTSMVFQDYALFPHLNARDNVAFGLKVRAVARPERARRADEMLGMLGLAGMGDRMPRQLSGGQRQRVAMGRSLILEPRVLLLDEPLGALDAQVRRQLQVELRSLQRRLGLTFVYVTHDQGEAMALSDRVAVMNLGRIIQDGAPDEVYRRPRSDFVARFLGDCNLLRGRRAEVADGRLIVDLEQLGRVHVAHPEEPFAADGPLTLALRPEDVTLTTAGTGRVDGRVRERAFLGANTRYVLEAGGLRIEAIVDQATVLELGGTIGVTWNDANLTVVAVETATPPQPRAPSEP